MTLNRNKLTEYLDVVFETDKLQPFGDIMDRPSDWIFVQDEP